MHIFTLCSVIVITLFVLVNMRGFTSVKHMVIAVLVVAFLSVLFLWHQSGSNLQDKQEDVNYSPQHWPSISQAKYRQFKEYIFPSVESGENIVIKGDLSPLIWYE